MTTTSKQTLINLPATLPAPTLLYNITPVRFQLKLTCLENNKYILKDMGIGNGTFLKIQRDYKLKHGELISIAKDINFIVFFDNK